MEETSNVAHRPAQPQHIDRSARRHPSFDYIYLIYASIWGLTTGLALVEALDSSAYWINRIALVTLPTSWSIYPFKPHNGFCNNRLSTREKAARITALTLATLLGASTNFLASQSASSLRAEPSEPYSTVENAGLFSIISLVVAANLLACRSLRQREPAQERLKSCAPFRFLCRSAKRTEIASLADEERSGGEQIAGQLVFVSAESDRTSQDRLVINLNAQIIELNKNNQKSAKIFAELVDFINKDPDLDAAFKQCLRATQEILLPPPRIDTSEPLSNPLVEEWRQARQTESYWQSMRTRVRDFLEKNSSFEQLLAEKFFHSDVEDKQELLEYFLIIEKKE